MCRTACCFVLQNIELFFSVKGVLEEARFFGIESLIPQLEAVIQAGQRSRDNAPLSRRDVVNALVITPYTAELRFQGVNLAGADLSRLDLRNINFKVCKTWNLFLFILLKKTTHILVVTLILRLVLVFFYYLFIYLS